MKKLIILSLVLLCGCDSITEELNGCARRKVEGIDCVVCNVGHAVSCNWSAGHE